MKQSPRQQLRKPPLDLATILLTIVMALSAGCPTPRQDAEIPLEPPSRFSGSGDQAVPDRWWRVFGDAKLDRLVEQALGANFDLATAWQRLREASAIVDRETAFLFPEVSGSAEAQARRPEIRGDGQLQLGLSAGYEVDLWGRIHSQVEAEEYRATATLADYRTAAITLSAEVVQSWFDLLEAHRQAELLDRQANTNEKVLELIISRFGSGQTRSVDVLRQQQLLESVREQKIITESRIILLEHQLAVLLGKPPGGSLAAGYGELPALPPLPATGLPIELVARRPDLLREFYLLQAADKDLAAAVSNLFPRLTLTASLFTDDSSGLFAHWSRAITAGLIAPLIDFGAREADVDRAEALRRQRLYAYCQAILLALREVEDALIQEKKQHERIASLRRQLRLADVTYERLRLEYFNGIGNYIDVLVALAGRQRLQRDVLAARLELLRFRISLYRALAGGFVTTREEQPQ